MILVRWGPSWGYSQPRALRGAHEVSTSTATPVRDAALRGTLHYYSVLFKFHSKFKSLRLLNSLILFEVVKC